MAQYPEAPFEPRVKENRRGVVYDETKKHFLFAEDLTKIEDEVVELEDRLTPDTENPLPYGIRMGSPDSKFFSYEYELDGFKIPLWVGLDSADNLLPSFAALGLVLINPTGAPYISFVNGVTGQTNLMSFGEDGLFSAGGVEALVTTPDEDTGIKECASISGILIGTAPQYSKAGIIYRDGAGKGLGARKKLAFSYSKINETGTSWKGGYCVGIFKNEAPNTPVEIIEIDGDGDTEIKQKLNVVNDLSCDSTIESADNFICNAQAGVTNTYTHVVDVRMNGTTLEKKTQTITITGGIVTNISAISDWI
jgi:hypothetical protein